MKPEDRKCECGEGVLSYTYGGETRTSRVFTVCAKHKADKQALVNIRLAMHRRLERKALPAPSTDANAL
jgi:hypothetical protein